MGRGAASCHPMDTCHWLCTEPGGRRESCFSGNLPTLLVSSLLLCPSPWVFAKRCARLDPAVFPAFAGAPRPYSGWQIERRVEVVFARIFPVLLFERVSGSSHVQTWVELRMPFSELGTCENESPKIFDAGWARTLLNEAMTLFRHALIATEGFLGP
jgi:hypothetical protein